MTDYVGINRAGKVDRVFEGEEIRSKKGKLISISDGFGGSVFFGGLNDLKSFLVGSYDAIIQLRCYFAWAREIQP